MTAAAPAKRAIKKRVRFPRRRPLANIPTLSGICALIAFAVTYLAAPLFAQKGLLDSIDTRTAGYPDTARTVQSQEIELAQFSTLKQQRDEEIAELKAGLQTTNAQLAQVLATVLEIKGRLYDDPVPYPRRH